MHIKISIFCKVQEPLEQEREFYGLLNIAALLQAEKLKFYSAEMRAFTVDETCQINAQQAYILIIFNLISGQVHRIHELSGMIIIYENYGEVWSGLWVR